MSKAIITEQHLHDIADTIIAKGGATAPMTPAQMAAAIANIPSGSSYPKQWKDDAKTHLWYSVLDGGKAIVTFSAQYISDGHTFGVDWGDGTIQTIAASSDYTNRTLTHTYSSGGDYCATISGYDKMKIRETSIFGTQAYDGSSLLALKQAEIYLDELEAYDVLAGMCGMIAIKFTGNYVSTHCLNARAMANLQIIEGMDRAPAIGNFDFYYCVNLKSIGDLSSIGSVASSNSFNNASSVSDLYFRLKTHSEVESITGFTYFPNRGKSCVFHCSDGDFYRSGTALLPVED